LISNVKVLEEEEEGRPDGGGAGDGGERRSHVAGEVVIN
jgi:hypothetical protein